MTKQIAVMSMSLDAYTTRNDDGDRSHDWSLGCARLGSASGSV
jgi:hypothetical protein